MNNGPDHDTRQDEANHQKWLESRVPVNVVAIEDTIDSMDTVVMLKNMGRLTYVEAFKELSTLVDRAKKQIGLTD